MSKSPGNVLDPFAIMDEYGTDALRFYLMREVSFGHDGAVSTAGFAARYESELANDFGNLASRTIAMVHRYRDGTVPDAELDPELAAEIDALAGEVCALLDRADLSGAARRDLAARAAAEPLRRGAGAVDARQGPRRARASSTRVLASLVEGLRVVAVVLHPWIPESTGKLLDALGAPQLDARGRARCRPAGSARSPSSSRCSPSRMAYGCGARRDRQPHAPARLQARRRRARRGGGRRGRDADAHRRHERRDLPRGAARRPSASRRCSRRSAAIPTRRRASTTPTSPSCRRSPRTRAASRSARPAWTTSATTRRAPTRSARSSPRSSSRARPASRSSSTRAPPRTTRSRRCASRPAAST